MNDKTTVLSQHFHDTLIKTAMIDEMARSDNWRSLDECLEVKPEVMENFTRYADAALRAIRRVENEAKITPLNLH